MNRRSRATLDEGKNHFLTFIFMEEAKSAKPKVPAGLKRCHKCGHFKGKCIQDGKPWSISCCCNLNICERCKTPVYEYKICSSIYDERDGRCWHIPIMCAWGHKCPDGVSGQLGNSFLIDPRTGANLLKPIREPLREKDQELK